MGAISKRIISFLADSKILAKLQQKRSALKKLSIPIMMHQEFNGKMESVMPNGMILPNMVENGNLMNGRRSWVTYMHAFLKVFIILPQSRHYLI